MAVEDIDDCNIIEFKDWYDGDYRIVQGRLMQPSPGNLAKNHKIQYQKFKSDMDHRVRGFYKYEKQAAAEVVSERKDFANVSSGDSAGYIERIAKNIVQNTPDISQLSVHGNDSLAGCLANYFLKSKIVGEDSYANDLQQHLTNSTERSLYLGFDAVIPVLTQDARGAYQMQYDTIHYRDVFPEPGAKDIRRAHEVYIRRYLTKGDVKSLIKNNTPGWDHAALKALLDTPATAREFVDKESKNAGYNPDGYEIITWYNDYGDPFLTFHPSTMMLLRIEKNKHPLKEHPVFFLVLKKDSQQPFGRSVLAKTFGRQEFQDLFLNGAFKMWARNIDPPIFGYGTGNTMPNLAPGTFTAYGNPQAKVEAFSIDTQTLQMFNSISQQNSGSMAQLIGNADQQMASQNTGGMMSKTPQGVEAQQQMVDITTNQFQKAVEAFLSRYLSYAMTIYFEELKSLRKFTPDARARERLIAEGVPATEFAADGSINIDMKSLAVLYSVEVAPGTLVELEDEKQSRLLNQTLVSLTQGLGAMASLQDPNIIMPAVQAINYIIKKQVSLTNSNFSEDIADILSGKSEEVETRQEETASLDSLISEAVNPLYEEMEKLSQFMMQQGAQLSEMSNGMIQVLNNQEGIPNEPRK